MKNIDELLLVDIHTGSVGHHRKHFIGKKLRKVDGLKCHGKSSILVSLTRQCRTISTVTGMRVLNRITITDTFYSHVPNICFDDVDDGASIMASEGRKVIELTIQQPTPTNG